MATQMLYGHGPPGAPSPEGGPRGAPSPGGGSVAGAEG